ncbi:MAG: hypothetical protein SGBAC_012860 [Bacillariaceae sp.]
MTDFIQHTLKAAGPNGVVLFSKSYCPYCLRAKNDLTSIGVSPVVVELDQRQDGREIQVALLQMTGQRTVPSAWVAGSHIGGSDDVRRHAHDGLFEEIATVQAAKGFAGKAGIQHCGAQDGAPCLYVASN